MVLQSDAAAQRFPVHDQRYSIAKTTIIWLREPKANKRKRVYRAEHIAKGYKMEKSVVTRNIINRISE